MDRIIPGTGTKSFLRQLDGQMPNDPSPFGISENVRRAAGRVIGVEDLARPPMLTVKDIRPYTMDELIQPVSLGERSSGVRTPSVVNLVDESVGMKVNESVDQEVEVPVVQTNEMVIEEPIVEPSALEPSVEQPIEESSIQESVEPVDVETPTVESFQIVGSNNIFKSPYKALPSGVKVTKTKDKYKTHPVYKGSNGKYYIKQTLGNLYQELPANAKQSNGLPFGVTVDLKKKGVIGTTECHPGSDGKYYRVTKVMGIVTNYYEVRGDYKDMSKAKPVKTITQGLVKYTKFDNGVCQSTRYNVFTPVNNYCNCPAALKEAFSEDCMCKDEMGTCVDCKTGKILPASVETFITGSHKPVEDRNVVEKFCTDHLHAVSVAIVLAIVIIFIAVSCMLFATLFKGIDAKIKSKALIAKMKVNEAKEANPVREEAAFTGGKRKCKVNRLVNKSFEDKVENVVEEVVEQSPVPPPRKLDLPKDDAKYLDESISFDFCSSQLL